MRENSSTPDPSPEQIDVSVAFDPEARQAQAEMDAFADTRIESTGNLLISPSPNGGLLQPPDDIDPRATIEEKQKAAANVYHDRQRQAHMDNSSAVKPYEDMTMVELASKLGEAEYHGDRTIEQDVGDILLDRIAVEEEKIHSDTYFQEGNPTEALWKSVMGIAEKKKTQLEQQNDAIGNIQAEENISSGDVTGDSSEPDNPNVPYDWEAEGAFEPVKEEAQPQAEVEEPQHVTSDEEPEPVVGAESDPEEAVEDKGHGAAEPPTQLIDDQTRDIHNPPSIAEVEDEAAEKPSLHETENSGLGFRVGRAELERRGEDTILDRRDMNLFGVFDGMGGLEHGAEASQAAAKAVEELFEGRPAEHTPQTEQNALEFMVYAIGVARQKASETGGHTTGVFGKIEEINGKPYLVWANAGDSRLFFEKDDGEDLILEISDEQVGQDGTTVYNALGGVWNKEKKEYVPFEEPVASPHDEFGIIELSDGDRIMLCSDGITGDYNPNNPDQNWQVMKPEEMREAFNLAEAQTVANRLLEMSRKPDDKSVLVIDAFDTKSKGKS